MSSHKSKHATKHELKHLAQDALIDNVLGLQRKLAKKEKEVELKNKTPATDLLGVKRTRDWVRLHSRDASEMEKKVDRGGEEGKGKRESRGGGKSGKKGDEESDNGGWGGWGVKEDDGWGTKENNGWGVVDRAS